MISDFYEKTGLIVTGFYVDISTVEELSAAGRAYPLVTDIKVEVSLP